MPCNFNLSILVIATLMFWSQTLHLGWVDQSLPVFYAKWDRRSRSKLKCTGANDSIEPASHRDNGPS